MFVTVITAFLFVWQHFYEIVLLSLDDMDATDSESVDNEANEANKEPLLHKAKTYNVQKLQIEGIDKRLGRNFNIV